MGIIQGKIYWAHIDPQNPRQKYKTTEETDKQWSLDLELTSTTAKVLQKLDLASSIRDGSSDAVEKVKGRKLNGKPTLVTNKPHVCDEFFFSFRNPAFAKDGKRQRPPTVVDGVKKDISGIKIGNGSLVNIKYNEWVNPTTGKTSIFLNAIQVIDLIEFEKEEDFQYLEDVGPARPLEEFESVSL